MLNTSGKNQSPFDYYRFSALGLCFMCFETVPRNAYYRLIMMNQCPYYESNVFAGPEPPQSCSGGREAAETLEVGMEKHGETGEITGPN